MANKDTFLPKINGYTIVAYSKETCKKFGLSYPSFGAFYACVVDFNPTCEECSMGTLEELAKWCNEN